MTLNGVIAATLRYLFRDALFIARFYPDTFLGGGITTPNFPVPPIYLHFLVAVPNPNLDILVAKW